MRHAKRTREGILERLATLSQWEPQAEQLLQRVLIEQKHKLVKADDVLDALVAYVTGQSAAPERHRLVGEPAVDDCGLPMQMVYRDGNPANARE